MSASVDDLLRRLSLHSSKARVSPLPQHRVPHGPHMETRRRAAKFASTAVVIVALVTIFLLWESFCALEYYQYGFKMRKSTQKVDVSEVYSGGNHLVGPDYSFKIYDASAQSMNLDNLAVFTSDNLEVVINVKFLYHLRKDELVQLFRNYNLEYHSKLKQHATDAIKGVTSQFTTWDYTSKRETVEDVLHRAVKERLGGICCSQQCEQDETKCLPDCLARSSCTDDDKGEFVDVDYFYLHEVIIPDEVHERQLKSVLLQEETEMEQYLQEAVIVRKQTERQVKDYLNLGQEISENATARANFLVAQAEALGSALVESSRSSSLALLYTELNFTAQEHKSSFDYLRSLRQMSGVRFNVAFDQLIAGTAAIAEKAVGVGILGEQ